MKPDVHYVRNGDVALAYQVIGEGPADLFVAIGYLSNLEYAWEIPSNAAFFRRLAASRRLILTDRRGSGLSDRFSLSDAPPQETLVEDVRVVLDGAGSARIALLGLFDGCMTATLFAATYPERVTSLILFSASPAGSVTEDLPGQWDEEQWEEWLASVRLGWAPVPGPFRTSVGRARPCSRIRICLSNSSPSRDYRRARPQPRRCFGSRKTPTSDTSFQPSAFRRSS